MRWRSCRHCPDEWPIWSARSARSRPARASWRSEQARLRENLAAVPPGAILRAAISGRLGASEDELTELASRLSTLRADQERTAAERRAFIRSLKI